MQASLSKDTTHGVVQCRQYLRCSTHPHLLGQGRIGVRIASLIAFLALVLRVPVRRIQAYLRTLHQLTISTGEIVELLHQVRRTLQAEVDALKQQARASPVLHGDETG